MDQERSNISIPLVVIGHGKAYKKNVQDFIRERNLNDRIIFLSDSPKAKCNDFKNGDWFPAIYQGAMALIYPSLFEGFGIPILEALWSKLPVITSDISSLPEVGGPSSLYVNPFEPSSIASAMRRILTDDELVKEMKEKGMEWAQKFSRATCAQKIHALYMDCIKKPA
jgi:glycosyltransferase involved in cell wall biosynthesis